MKVSSSLVLVLALLISGCTTPNAKKRTERIQRDLAARRTALTPELEEKILTLDPEHITEKDVREVLATAPAPRIINIQGGVIPLQLGMKSFSQFLIGMGYPEWSVRNPRNGHYSLSSYRSSAKIAGTLAWYYEADGLRPMIIGHSLGGMQVVKTLHKIVDSSPAPEVWNPFTQRKESRHEITDPLTGETMDVSKLKVSFASAMGAGGLARTIPNQWEIDSKLRQIPNSVEEFIGFYIGGDIFGGDYLGFGPANLFHAVDKAQVRNVRLPTGSSHTTVPVTKYLLSQPAALEWIDHYNPKNAPAADDQKYLTNARIQWAAEVWHGVKKHWVMELQRFIRARRAIAPNAHDH